MSQAQASQPSDVRIRRVAIPVFVLLGYLAFILTGYNSLQLSLAPHRQSLVLPLYAFFSLVLLMLEVVISDTITVRRILYVALTSGFALGFVAEIAFFGGEPTITRNPLTYVVIHIAALLAFLYGLATRRRPSQVRSEASAEPRSYDRVAGAFTGFALLGFLFWGLLDLVQSQLGVIVRIPGLQGVGIMTLADLDRDLGLAGAFAGLVVVVMVGLFTGGSAFLAPLRRIVDAAVTESGFSLRFVLSPLIWFVPAASIAVFSAQVTQTLFQASQRTQGPVIDLFNPFSPASQSNYLSALQSLGLGILSVLAVMLAVAALEYSRAAVVRAAEIVSGAARGVGVVLAIFLVSLAVLNALLIMVNVSLARPFQLGAASMVGLLAAVILISVGGRRDQRTPSNDQGV